MSGESAELSHSRRIRDGPCSVSEVCGLDRVAWGCAIDGAQAQAGAGQPASRAPAKPLQTRHICIPSRLQPPCSTPGDATSLCPAGSALLTAAVAFPPLPPAALHPRRTPRIPQHTRARALPPPQHLVNCNVLHKRRPRACNQSTEKKLAAFPAGPRRRASAIFRCLTAP